MTDIFFSIFTPIVTCILNYVCMTYFFGEMSNGKKQKQWLPVCIISFFVFLFSMYFVREPVLKMTLTGFATVLYTFLFAYKLYNRLFVSVAYIALCAIGENITTYLAIMFFDINFYMIKNGWAFLAASIVAKLVGFVFVYFVVVSKKQLLYGSFRLAWISLYLLPVSTIFASVTIYNVLKGSTPSFKLNAMGLASMSLLVASNFLVFKIVDNMRRKAEYEIRLKYAEELVKNQTNQYDILFNSNREVYRIQHDNKNFLLGVVSELQAGKSDTATLMLNERIDSISKNEINTLTGNSVVDTVLNHKFAEARNKDVKVEFEHKNLGSIKLSGIDFAVLIGNALDNAVEASESLPESDRCIRMVIVVANDRINVSIANNVKEDINPDCLKTGKINPDRHGFGIINMQSIAAKYNGEVVFECKDRVFKTIIVVDNMPV